MPAGLANAASNANGGTAAAVSLGLTVTQGSQCPLPRHARKLRLAGVGRRAKLSALAEKWLHSYY